MCLALASALLLAACGDLVPEPDWQEHQTVLAEHAVADLLGDPGARFPHVAVVGDDKTGQVCGLVRQGDRPPVRFVYYIDRTAGPYVDEGSSQALGDRFDFAWQNDCLREGYR